MRLCVQGLHTLYFSFVLFEMERPISQRRRSYWREWSSLIWYTKNPEGKIIHAPRLWRKGKRRDIGEREEKKSKWSGKSKSFLSPVFFQMFKLCIPLSDPEGCSFAAAWWCGKNRPIGLATITRGLFNEFCNFFLKSSASKLWTFILKNFVSVEVSHKCVNNIF